MNKIIPRVLFCVVLIGLGYVSHELQSANSLAEALVLTEELFDKDVVNPESEELMKRVESEIQEFDKLNQLIRILDASIILLLLAFYLSTRESKPKE